ncbi:outer membrane protein assembly factor BamA [Candidatus Phycosocius bacilliformis]|uniref:Outer membrane protein assembly factor BamA n=1 Tax=Candidatus Phycosocius bacilliformis TaxID=1445552 RepID=A0A2P2EE64_9PROT|nr:outer membrane protein assembly factor BamA [Candidatus Phycosocius bacilliformis]GBF59360.1 outer membrane protein assembly factor BamA [Candidatus Phycosocius bacilliformis]
MEQGLTGSFMATLKSLLICGAAALALNAGYGSLASAQQSAGVSEPAPQIITSVQVEGNQRIETATVLAYVAIQPGEAFSSERIDIALKTLFATGFFANVEFEQRGQTLVVKVAENPTVNQVLFEGNSAVTKDKLEKEVQIRPRSWFTQNRVQADIRRMQEVYRRSGKFAATIVPKIKVLPSNRVDLIFEITEGRTTGIRKVNFIGNQAFSDSRLKSVVVTQESEWWRFFSSKDNYDPDKLEYDREQLRKFYLNEGHYDFRVKSAVAELTPDQKDFFVTYAVEEGPKFTFGDITVNTKNSKLSGDVLRAFVPIRSGEMFQRDLVEKAIESITFAAGSAGYAFVDVRPRETADRDNKKVNIVFDVDEGPRVYVERIDIIGNTATLDQVIRRELRLAEGDAFNRVLIDRSKNRVKALGFFKEVEIEEKPGSLPDRTVVEVKVEEQATGELAFSVGYASQEAYNFAVSISQRNLRGRGQFLRFRVETSSRTKNIDIRFTEPRFLGRNLAAGIDVFSIEQDYLREAGFLTQSTGFGLRGGFPLAEDRSLGLRYTFRNDTNEIPSVSCFNADGTPILGASALCRSLGKTTTSLAGYSFNWDRRDDPRRPTRGFDLSISQDLAGVGTGVKYHRTELNGGVYRGLFPGWRASATLSAGYIAGYGGDTIRVNDRFFKGGQSFRGFEIAGIGPRTVFSVRDPDTTQPNGLSQKVRTIYGDALGGKAYGIASFELTVPTPLPESYGITAALFVDVGTLGGLDPVDKVKGDINYGTYQNTRDGLALRASAGLSVNWVSPFGPVRFDFSNPFLKEEYDKAETFRFSTATNF